MSMSFDDTIDELRNRFESAAYQRPVEDVYLRLRNRRRRRLAVATGVVATTVVVVFSLFRTTPADVTVAASPATGQDLTVIHEKPTVLRGAPATQDSNSPAVPDGTDLSFTPIDEPTPNDLEAIDTVVDQEAYVSPVVVALGTIDAFDTNVYLIHDSGPDALDRSTIVAIGPGYPAFVSHTEPTDGWLERTGGRSIDGSGQFTMRVPDDALYVQVDTGESTFWQRPSDSFVWIPFTADPGQDVVVTGLRENGPMFAPFVMPALPPSSTTSDSAPTLTDPPQPDPTYDTFESTLECDADSDQAALQVVQAFFTAYNERDLDRLQQLTNPALNEIWDPSALPHTGQVLSTDTASWAQAGWEIDDQFELRQLVDYGPHAGSDIILIRRNQAIDALEIDGLIIGFKVSSGGCTIARLVGHISSAITNCPFFDLYEDQLTEQLGSDWDLPSVCAS